MGIRLERFASLTCVIKILTWLIAGAIPLSLQAQETQGLLFNADLALQTDSNVLRQNTAVSDNAFIFSPKIGYLNNFSKHQITIGYAGAFAAYSDNQALNYDSHDIGIQALLTNTYPFSSEFALAYQDKIEEPGSTNAAMASITDFNHLNQTTALAKVNAGTVESTGQIILALEHNEQNYTNNLQDYRDVDRNQLTSTFFYRIAPKTRMLFEASTANYDYKPSLFFGDQSSKETRYLTGAEWSLTAKTTGIFKLGYQTKNFAQNYFNDVSGLSYLLDMIWQPNTYTKVTIGASRLTNESAQLGVGGFVSNSYTVALEHEIKSRTTLSLGYSPASDEIRSGQDRTDKRSDLKLSLNYQLNTWLYLGFDYRHINRDSDDSFYDFGSNLVGLSLSTKFE